MKSAVAWTLLLALVACPGVASAQARRDVVRLSATADIWLADTTPAERNSSAGQYGQFKLKSIQEMAAIRFDAARVRGRGILSARLFLRPAGRHMLRYLRVSTVNQDWVEGRSSRAYGTADGATYLWADAGQKKAWSYPGSEFADVVMGMGHTITTYAGFRQEPGGWISVALTPEIVYALVAGNTDGLAVMDGGNLAFSNNFIQAVQSGSSAPYIEVEAGNSLDRPPARPQVAVEPAPAHAHAAGGAIQVSIQPDPDAFCWKLQLDGRSVPRWQVPYPPAVQQTGKEQEQIRNGRTPPSGPVTFHLDNLDPRQPHTLVVVAVARGGAVSAPTQVVARSSAALQEAVQLGALVEPVGRAAAVKAGARFAVWPVPGLVKVGPERSVALSGDLSGDGTPASANAIWDGRTIRLFGSRGEYVSYQLVIDRLDPARPLTDVRVLPGELKGAAGTIGGRDIEISKNWYARNASGQWQPAYTVPWEGGRTIEIPDRQRGITTQKNQSLYVDVFVPKTARAGAYTGAVTVEAGADKAVLPIALQVYDFALPDTLAFLPELNSYSVPSNLLDYHRLAHQHRLVFNPWVMAPPLQGAGRDARVQWAEYDKAVGPLLSGEAFKANRRAGVPTPVMYLPFVDSWPTPLSPQTYGYQGHWPAKGEPRQTLVDHAMGAPYIGDGLSQSYKDAFLAVERQFIEHFRQQGWNRTEMQLFFGGKNTHRLDFGTNMWWTTDEPYHWEDWMALQFFDNLWATGRKAAGGDPRIWPARADLSRPMWTGRVLDTITNVVYWGGFDNVRWYQRAAWLAENTGIRTRVYGAVNPATESNTQTLAELLDVWAHGADGFLPWQTLGNDGSLDRNDNIEGDALLVPGTRFGVPVVGDLRLKALRDGEQIVEYLVILAERYQLQREEIAVLLGKALPMSVVRTAGASLDDAGAVRFGTLKDWQIAALRRRLADLIVTAPPARAGSRRLDR